MEMWVIAVLLGLSWTLILTGKIAKILDMSYKMFLRFGVCLRCGRGSFVSRYNSRTKKGPLVSIFGGVDHSAHRRSRSNCRFFQRGGYTPTCACEETRPRPHCTNS